jgi:hypothetical protein
MPALGGGVFCRCGSVLHRNTPRRRPIPDFRESRAAPTRGEACRDAGKTVGISVAVNGRLCSLIYLSRDQLF